MLCYAVADTPPDRLKQECLAGALTDAMHMVFRALWRFRGSFVDARPGCDMHKPIPLPPFCGSRLIFLASGPINLHSSFATSARAALLRARHGADCPMVGCHSNVASMAYSCAAVC